jgi:hypothetical protein
MAKLLKLLAEPGELLAQERHQVNITPWRGGLGMRGERTFAEGELARVPAAQQPDALLRQFIRAHAR